MLLTNIAVAQQVAVHFSEQAMLRRHDSPIERRLVSCMEDLADCITDTHLRTPSSSALLAWDTKLT